MINLKSLNKRVFNSFVIVSLCLISCSEQETLIQKNEQITSEIVINKQPVNNRGVQTSFTPGVFKRKNTGYQGPSQETINSMPKFIVTEFPRENATERIQAAIDKASKIKGGRVIIQKGRYIVKPINLKSNVHIRIKPNVIIRADQTDTSLEGRLKHKDIFLIGRRENIQNVSIVGLGKGDSRPKFRYFRETGRIKGGARAFSVNGVKNCFIQNVLIEDNQTRFSGIDFNFNFSDISKAGRPTNITIDNCEIKKAAYGYGLVQVNVGLNVLLSNLTGDGGITARLESDNRTFKSETIGIENAHVENVLTVNGNTCVLLQPWNVTNGNVFIDGVHAINCNFAVELQDGYLDTEGKGRFGLNSYIKNVSAEYGLTATGHFAHDQAIPNCLYSFFKKNAPSPDAEDAGARVGPSISTIGNFITREHNRVKIFENTVSAYVPKNTHPANKVSSRALIITGKGIAHRGDNNSKQCGANAYK